MKEKFSVIGLENGRGKPGEGLGQLLGAEYSRQLTVSKNKKKKNPPQNWVLQSYNETLKFHQPS